MTVEITNDDYTEADWGLVYEAGAEVMAVIQDIAFHHLNPAEGWDPMAKPGHIADLVAEVRAHVERLEGKVREARGRLARVENTARLCAVRRTRAGR